MQVIKRDGRLVIFDKDKIVNAVLAAFNEVDGEITDQAKNKANEIASYINERYKDAISISVESIQDIIEEKLMASKRKDVARAYIIYRNKRNEVRGNLIDHIVFDYLDGTNEYWSTENSNKDSEVVTTQRDYLAGILSTDIARRYLLPKDVCEAHDAGIIHQHDMDYMAQKALSNCELINLEDMLQNGTVINSTKIDKPHRLITATTIATQIITAVSSSTYGGATITLTHLAPFVKDSYNIYLKKYKDRGFDYSKSDLYAQEDLSKEIEDAVQTFNYQINSMSNTNGQSPFISVMIYLNEDREYTNEVALLAKEFFKQRIQGMKNEAGAYVTQAFPKLLYTLDENNIYEDSEYWWLTELAAKCTAKRMVPDYISAKKMKEYKNGDVYPCINITCA